MWFFNRESLEVRLARKKAEYATLQSRLNSAVEYPSFWVDKLIALSGDIAAIEKKISINKERTCAAQNRNDPTTT
jgi:hypothetical protein